MLSFIGSVCAPDGATLKAEDHAFQCSAAGPYNAVSSELLEVGSVCGLGPDVVSIHSISLAARYRAGFEKVSAARGHNGTPLFNLSLALGT